MVGDSDVLHSATRAVSRGGHQRYDGSEEAVDEVVSIMSECRPASMKTMLLAFAECDLRHVLPSIDIPTLLLYGEQDVRSPLRVAGEMHEQIPGSSLVVVPGVGHLVNIEAPAQFDAEV